MKASVLTASGSDETESYTPRDVAVISEAIKARGITVVDVIKALHKRGFARGGGEPPVAGQAARLRRLPADLGHRPRRAHVISAVNDPNDYRGPGHRLPRVGGAPPGDQRDPRRARPRDGARARKPSSRSTLRRTFRFEPSARRRPARTPREVVIGVSPAFGVKFFRTLGGIPLADLLQRDGRGHRKRRRHRADRAHAPYRRHLVPRADRRAAVGLGDRHRHPGQGHGGHPPGRPAAAQQPRAFLQRADHHARALPQARPQRRAIRVRRAAGAGRRADARRGDGLALPCARRADLRDRNIAHRPTAPRRRRSRSAVREPRHGRAAS